MGTANAISHRIGNHVFVDQRSSREEEWRPVVGFEDRYEVSNLGRVKSVARIVVHKNGFEQKIRERIRAISNNVNGYKAVTLNFEGKGYRRLVSHMVAEAFIGPRPSGMEVSHENGRLEDNAWDNLKYRTKQSNEDLKKEHGTYAYGDRMPWAKLKNDDIPVIKSLVAAGESCLEVAEKYSVSETTISRIVRKKTWINC